MSELTPSGGSGHVIPTLKYGENGLMLPKPFERDIYLFSTHIAGTSYVTGIKDLEPSLNVDDRLKFYREPSNPYDKEAIVVKNLYGVKLGYIPRKDNVIFARLMDAGKLLFGKIKSKEFQGEYLFIKIDIYLNE